MRAPSAPSSRSPRTTMRAVYLGSCQGWALFVSTHRIGVMLTSGKLFQLLHSFSLAASIPSLWPPVPLLVIQFLGSGCHALLVHGPLGRWASWFSSSSAVAMSCRPGVRSHSGRHTPGKIPEHRILIFLIPQKILIFAFLLVLRRL